MKKTLQRFGMVTVGLSLCLWSCKEDNKPVQPSEIAVSKDIPKIKENIDFSVVDGRLKFETMEDFKGAVAKNLNQQEMKKWEMNSGFTSMSEAYRDFMKSDIEEGAVGINRIISQEFDDVITVEKDRMGKNNYSITLPYPALSCLTNKDGLIQIGNNVIKITNKESRIANVKYIDELKANTLSNHIEVHKINHNLGSQSNKNSKILNDWEDISYVPYYPGGGFANRRFKIHKYFDDIFLGWNGDFDEPEYNYVYATGIYIIHQRDNWYGWGSIWIDGWSWDAGSVNLEKTYSNYTYPKIYPFTSGSWGSSGGIVNINTEALFLGTYGFIADDGIGNHLLKVTADINNVKGYTFGQKDLDNLSFTKENP
jgi:hypothetical protein